MRFVLCDHDPLLQTMVEDLVEHLGHEVVGITDSTADATILVERARPDVVIVDLAIGYNTDFDVVAAALEAGATPIVFTHTADESWMQRYETRPVVVPKPDVVELERAIRRLEVGPADPAVADRRLRPSRAAEGPPPTDLADAQAFFEALGNLEADDALLTVELPREAPGVDLGALAHQIAVTVRETDRLLASSSVIRAFLPGAGDVGVASLVGRLAKLGPFPAGARVISVVAAPGETSTDAFDRLKVAGHVHDLPS